MKDGNYNYYPPNIEKPILVQVENDWVYSLHFEYTYHVSKFPGRFVLLVEVCEGEAAKEPHPKGTRPVDNNGTME